MMKRTDHVFDSYLPYVTVLHCRKSAKSLQLLQNVLVSRDISLVCTVLYTEVPKINNLLIINRENQIF